MRKAMSDLMELLLRDPKTAREVHEVAMTDGRRTVTTPDGRRVVLFTARGGQHLKFKDDARRRRNRQVRAL